MADAYVIQSDDETAGIVVLERNGVRFFAAGPAYWPLDGKIFKTPQAATRAVDDFRRGRPFAAAPDARTA